MRSRLKRVLQTKRATYSGLKPVEATNWPYKRFHDYRYYRVPKATQSRKSRDTSKNKKHIKRMALTARTHNFTGDDAIEVLHFQPRFVREATVLRMSEAQAYIALPYFLRALALQQYGADSDACGDDEGGVA